MQSWMFTCILLSACTGILKRILEACGNQKGAELLQSVFYILVLAVTVDSLGGTTLPNYTYTADDQSSYFAEQEANMMDEVFRTAEAELGERLCEELKERFSIEQVQCNVSVNRETLALEYVTIVLYNDNRLISTYEIQNYMYTVYGVKAEVNLQ